MSSGIYISVKNGVGGTIYCENTEADWSTSGSSPEGYGGFTSGTSTFTAEPAAGYEFSCFKIFIDTSSEDYDSGISNGTKYDNPLEMSNTYAGNGGSYLVQAVFEGTTTTHTISIYTYKDGVPYEAWDVGAEDGTVVKLSAEVPIPSGYAISSILIDGTNYSNLPTFTVYDDRKVQVYFTKLPTRPSNWSWTSTVAAGAEIKLSATEWNNFTARINAFRTYKGLSTLSFTNATSGMAITASICNEAWSAVNDLRSYQSTYSMPSQLTAGGDFPAAFFNGLKNIINKIT